MFWKVSFRTDDNINYTIEIYDQNFNLIISQALSDSEINISYLDLDILIGEINSYSWKVSVDNLISSDWFYFGIDASSLNANNNQINEFNLYQNYPNPFNPTTCISFDVSSYNFITITVYDINGVFIEKIVENYYSPGSYNVYWRAFNYPSGIYIYEMSSNESVFKRKMLLVKWLNTYL